MDHPRPPVVIMPWLGFGTYRLGKEQAKHAVAQALECGYRAIDSAFIYGGETTEKLVGEAVRDALERGVIHSRNEVFITTKHWRKYHGYEPTLQCLKLSLKRLQVDFVDLYLMHWPGPAWKTMHRKKEVVETDPWHYAVTESTEMVSVRAETWRAMEDAVKKGLCRAIGVSNMKVGHLEELKKTATLWPPAVNQVEFQYVLTGNIQAESLCFHCAQIIAHRETISASSFPWYYCVARCFHKRTSWNIAARKA